MLMDVLNAHSDRYSSFMQALQSISFADTLQKGFKHLLLVIIQNYVVKYMLIKLFY